MGEDSPSPEAEEFKNFERAGSPWEQARTRCPPPEASPPAASR